MFVDECVFLPSGKLTMRITRDVHSFLQRVSILESGFTACLPITKQQSRIICGQQIILFTFKAYWYCPTISWSGVKIKARPVSKQTSYGLKSTIIIWKQKHASAVKHTVLYTLYVWNGWTTGLLHTGHRAQRLRKSQKDRGAAIKRNKVQRDEKDKITRETQKT